jgi:hypothetical protein
MSDDMGEMDGVCIASHFYIFDNTKIEHLLVTSSVSCAAVPLLPMMKPCT